MIPAPVPLPPGRPAIVSVFLPFAGCRERCLFCNQKTMAREAPSPSAVQTFLQEVLPKTFAAFQNRERQIAFYGGSFTAMDLDAQVRYLEAVQPFLSSGLVGSLRVSTRPDVLDEGTLSLLRHYGVKTVEIGAQSMDPEVLDLSLRGHTPAHTASATERLKNRGFRVGLQLMIGLPGDTLPRFLSTLDAVIGLRPDFVRIHPTLVFEEAPLSSLWRDGTYTPLSLAEAVHWLKIGLLRLESASIPVARLGLQPTKELEAYLLAGPYHPALRQLVDSSLAYDMASHLLMTSGEEHEGARLLCHPKDLSNVRGQGNENLRRLKSGFPLADISIEGDGQVPRGCLVLELGKKKITMQRKDLRYEAN